MSAVKAISFYGIVGAIVCLPACSFVDYFTPRQYELNVNSQQALNEESLLNIIRASRFDPLTFVAISQLTGGQTEAFNFGIPTITFGAGQTPIQKQFIFGGNLVQNSVNGAFTMNPLISSDFENGMLASVPTNTIAELILSYSREPVFYTIIESIKLTRCPTKSGSNVPCSPNEKETSVVYNHPGDDSDFLRNGMQVSCNQIFKELSPIMSARYPDITLEDLDTEFYSSENENYCTFSKFVAVLNIALSYGLTVEIPSTEASDQGGGAESGVTKSGSGVTPRGASKTNNSSGPGASGSKNKSSGSPQGNGSGAQNGPKARFCFDDGLADPRNRTQVLALHNWCGNANPPKNFGFPFRHVTIEFAITLRSPTAIFAYLGALVRKGRIQNAAASAADGSQPPPNPLADRMNYSTPEMREFKTEPFLNIVPIRDSNCFVHVNYLGINYCIPTEGSMNTGIILQVLQRLRNLSVSPADLNIPFTTRLLQ